MDVPESIDRFSRLPPAGDRRLNTAVVSAFVLAVTVLSVFTNYDFKDLSGHFRFDLFQSVADGFRAGQLSVLEGRENKIFMDLTPQGNGLYYKKGPLPPLLYAFLDTIWLFFGCGLFPKVLILFVFLAFHQYFMLLLLRRIFGRRSVLPFLLLVFYAFSLPYWLLVNTLIDVCEIAILMSSTFFLGGLYYYSYLFDEESSLDRYVLCSVFLACALLTRVTYFITVFIMTIPIVLSKRGLKKRLVFGLVAIGGVAVQFFYNYQRFGNPLEFGEILSLYNGVWVEVVYTMEVLPFSLERSITRIIHSLYGYLGIDLRMFVEGSIDSLFYGRGQSVHFGIQYLPLFLGLVSGACIWRKNIRDHIREVALVAAMFAVIVFYVSYLESVELRYLMDFWPLAFLLSLQGIVDVANTRIRKVHRNAFLVVVVALIASSTILIQWQLRDSLAQTLGLDPVAVEEQPFKLGAHTHYGKGRGRTITETSLDCPSIHPRYRSFGEIPAREDRLDRLGIYRVSEDACYMLFFSGATLAFEPGKDCRIELVLDPQEVRDCGRITFYHDGHDRGGMRNAAGAETDRKVCTSKIPATGQRMIQAYFFFNDVDLNVSDLMQGTQRFRMYRLATLCD